MKARRARSLLLGGMGWVGAWAVAAPGGPFSLGCDRVCGVFYEIDDAAPDASIPASTMDARASTMDARARPTESEDASEMDAKEIDGNSFEGSPAPACPKGFATFAAAKIPVDASIVAIAFDTNGALWFATTNLKLALGSVETLANGGTAVAFPADTSTGLRAAAVAAGRDQAMWFTLQTYPFALARVAAADAQVTTLVRETFVPRAGLTVDVDSRLWWIESRPFDGGDASALVWIDPDAAVAGNAPTEVPVRLGSLGAGAIGQPGPALVALAADDNGYTWFIGSAAGIPIWGRARADGSSEVAALPSPASGPRDIVTNGNVAWGLVGDQGAPADSWLVRAEDLDAATILSLPLDAGTPTALARLSAACGILVAHAFPAGLTLVSTDGDMAELSQVDSGLPFTGASVMAVGDGSVAVASGQQVDFLRLLP